MKSKAKETKEIKSKKVKNNRWQLINLMVLYRHKETQKQTIGEYNE